MLTQEILKERLNYNPETGVFTRNIKLPKCKNQIPVGAVNKGYLVISLYRRYYRAHRLAWLYVTGEWPDGVIDHRDGNSLNNKFENLRQCSVKENCENLRKARKTSKSGILGVSWHKQMGKWRASIKNNGKFKSIGLFHTPEDAYTAYLAAKRELHPFCTI
jgi:hypothetical protein